MEDYLPIRKRNRPSLVCEPCKRRKVKCDKGRPCGSCTKNNFPHKCSYGPTFIGEKKKGSSKVSKTDKVAASSIKSTPTKDGMTNVKPVTPMSYPGSVDKNGVTGSATNKDPMVLVSVAELNALKERLHKLEQGLQKETSKSTGEFANLSKTPEDPESNDLFEVTYRQMNINVDKNSRTLVLNQYVFDPKLREAIPEQLQAVCRFIQGIQPPISPESVDIASPSFSYKSSTEMTQDSTSTSPTTLQPSDLGEDELVSPAYIMGVNPYSSNDDYINFYDNYTSVFLSEPSRRTNYGPFSWAAISRKDKLLATLKKFMQKQQKQGKEGNVKSKDLPDEIENNENRAKFQKKELESDGVVDLMPYEENARIKSVSETLLTTKSDFTLPDGHVPYDTSSSSSSFSAYSSFSNNKKRKGPSLVRKPQLKVSDTTILSGIHDGSLDNELKLISKIESILPKQRVLWLLIHRFFSFIYPYLPYIDERDFRGEMNRILGPEDYKDRKILQLNISKRLDFAYLGMLLVFLRFSYLSIESKHSKFRVEPSLSQNCEYLLANPIDTNVIDVAKSCINQFQIMRKFNFTVFQATFYLRLYHIYAPEEGDGADGGDSLVFNGLLVQMAYSIGIHREPGNFNDDTLKDERVNSLGRKIWHHILVHDFVDSYTFGTPMATSEKFYDSKVPFIMPGVNENVIDLELEKASIDFNANCGPLLRGPMQYILKLALDVKKKVKMSELTKHVNFMEICTFNAFGRTGDYITYLEDKDMGFRFAKANRLKISLSLKSFYLSLFYHFFLHYEEKNHSVLMFFYLKKMLTISICEIIPYLFPIIYGIYDFFEDGVDIFINPIFLQMLHRTSEVNIAAIVRTNFVIYAMKTEPNHQSKLRSSEEYRNFFESYCLLEEYMEKCARVCIAALTVLSDRYYYAWGAARSQTFIYKIVTNEEFYVEADRRNPSRLTLAQTEELISMYGPPLELAEKIVKEHCNDEKIENVFRKKAHEVRKDTQKTGEQAASLLASNTIPPALTAHNKSFNLNKHWENPTHVAYSPVPETPSFIRSYSNVIASEFEDLYFSNSAEIDSVWLQMLTSKTDNNVVTRESSTMTDTTKYDLALHANSNASTNNNSNDSNSNSSSFNYSQEPIKIGGQQNGAGNSIPSFSNHNHTFNIHNSLTDPKANLNIEDSTHFNFFSDLPLDKVFQTNNI
ncbi:multidrug resistance regulator 1 [[Candida] railenensis]|uniref:Multidrug resistance regulator 1 n=1 Tax=[Candida] railenensis TaxID=45579 RepID=A0A9P0W1F8_9ASCO|nr:multidrug resistance regulator 1 [[Candida] railenensis]